MMSDLSRAVVLRLLHKKFAENWQNKSIQVETVAATLVRDDDAEYIYGLRINDRLNEHISAPPPSIAAQRQWIANYLKRFAAGEELYFIVRRLNGTPCGTFRLYNYQLQTYTAGSWILDENRTLTAAAETLMLIFDIGFKSLGFERCNFDVRKRNRSLAIHFRYGAEITGEDDDNIYLTLSANKYATNRATLTALVKSRHNSEADSVLAI